MKKKCMAGNMLTIILLSVIASGGVYFEHNSQLNS